jgi:hypothetical protein
VLVVRLTRLLGPARAGRREVLVRVGPAPSGETDVAAEPAVAGS